MAYLKKIDALVDEFSGLNMQLYQDNVIVRSAPLGYQCTCIVFDHLAQGIIKIMPFHAKMSMINALVILTKYHQITHATKTHILKNLELLPSNGVEKIDPNFLHVAVCDACFFNAGVNLATITNGIFLNQYGSVSSLEAENQGAVTTTHYINGLDGNYVPEVKSDDEEKEESKASELRLKNMSGINKQYKLGKEFILSGGKITFEKLQEEKYDNDKIDLFRVFDQILSVKYDIAKDRMTVQQLENVILGKNKTERYPQIFTHKDKQFVKELEEIINNQHKLPGVTEWFQSCAINKYVVGIFYPFDYFSDFIMFLPFVETYSFQCLKHFDFCRGAYIVFRSFANIDKQKVILTCRTSGIFYDETRDCYLIDMFIRQDTEVKNSFGSSLEIPHLSWQKFLFDIALNQQNSQAKLFTLHLTMRMVSNELFDHNILLLRLEESFIRSKKQSIANELLKLSASYYVKYFTLMLLREYFTQTSERLDNPPKSVFIALFNAICYSFMKTFVLLTVTYYGFSSYNSYRLHGNKGFYMTILHGPDIFPIVALHYLLTYVTSWLILVRQQENSTNKYHYLLKCPISDLTELKLSELVDLLINGNNLGDINKDSFGTYSISFSGDLTRHIKVSCTNYLQYLSQYFQLTTKYLGNYEQVNFSLNNSTPQ